MIHLHARAVQLYIFQQTKPFNIPVDKAPTDKEQCCSSSLKRRMFLGQNLIVSVFVLNASLDTRFLISGEICSWWQWFHRQVCTSGWVTSMPPWYVLQDRWTRENIQFLLPFTTLVDGEIHQSHHICRGAEKPLLPCLVSQQPPPNSLSSPTCSLLIISCIMYWLPGKHGRRKW